MIEFSYEAIIERILSKNRWGSEGALATELGIAPNTWTAYKKGVRSFGLHEVAKICDILEVTPHWLLFGTEGLESDLRGRVEKLIRELHDEAKIYLPDRAVAIVVDRHYTALLSQIVEPDDREEIDLRLRLLRKEISKEIAEARVTPGSGKRSA
ncbi:transcriptional regulator with XRE-family HTH domain [Sinorhizobium fredii]|uniref:helix-turn-helix domain-containing protein n=1 Tax=Rhizobium fredii TaxID=380 RepID=UPI0035131A65